LNRWKNNFCQVLNVHGDNYITWKYVWQPVNAFELQVPVDKLKMYDSVDNDIIQADLVWSQCQTVSWESVHQQTNALNKIHFMTSIRLLHVWHWGAILQES
jgi:hypothetical protein